jgi:DNA-directed RNA polymerase subunit M/transcription elongation factor TFIIS
MFFCPNCNNVFNITQEKTSHKGGADKQHDEDDNYEAIIKKIIDQDKILDEDIKKISFDDFTKSIHFKRLKSKQKEMVYNKIQDLIPVDKKKVITDTDESVVPSQAYFKCYNCGYIKSMDPGTLIFSKVSSDIAESYSGSDVSVMKHSDILPRTVRYHCPNDKCITHKDPSNKEAVFFRMNNTYKIRYVCTLCDTVF